MVILKVYEYCRCEFHKEEALKRESVKRHYMVFCDRHFVQDSCKVVNNSNMYVWMLFLLHNE